MFLPFGICGVSTFAAQIALASGASVIVTSSLDEKLQIARKLGVQHRISYSPNWDEEIVCLTWIFSTLADNQGFLLCRRGAGGPRHRSEWIKYTSEV
ncbi:hypothetical protein BKA82DRAFT_772646 [Pisolithus tinctorius]|uniref:Alcohol dehydrogenase-like C-terminal domain-containing protein n=1 Tax=Pisolithus tinctorius Marx 270 TaxID=870435 RepID=A0A0C3NXG9_PISTI|nr:hypothetical protein BKA82DRAFT_772646 [Pisolithus tinctorius]KIO00021.1 hypothetical protein M404DRAFT_772646 [Pisolithus tinctorius Marx 270]